VVQVHLLNEERGAVIETLVARTLRQVEASQSMIRIVGLSATLPNYLDAAEFLRVNQQTVRESERVRERERGKEAEM
jgi:replicative superfamily II helicase